MAICEDCKKDMSDPKTETCTLDTIILDGVSYARSRFHFNEQSGRCHDCNILHGGIHHSGCDVERDPNPKCHGQLISCGCLDDAKHVDFVKMDIPPDLRVCKCGHHGYIHEDDGGCKFLVYPKKGVSKDHYTDMMCPCMKMRFND